MPAKLCIGLSRKIGEANFGSRGASVNLEIELDALSLQDPQLVRERVRALYAVARESVNEELACESHSPQQSVSHDSHRHSARHSGSNGNGHAAESPERRSVAGTATQSQVRAIYAIARAQGVDPQAFVHERFRRESIEELSIREASQCIDQLKGDAREVPA